VSGSLRANIVAEQPISVSDPSTLNGSIRRRFCAPSATCVNPNGSNFGDAGRNIIEGPGQVSLNIVAQRDDHDQGIPRTRAAHLRDNVFNTVHFTSINTVGEFLYVRGGHRDGRHAARDDDRALPVLKEDEYGDSEKDLFILTAVGLLLQAAPPVLAQTTGQAGERSSRGIQVTSELVW